MRWHISWVRQLPHRLRWPCDLMGLVPYDKSIGFKRTARYCSAFPNTTSGHRLTDRRNRRLSPISSGSLDHPEIIRAINWCAGRCYDRPVRMVSLMTHDARAARQFVLRTLGRLATDSVVLQRSLHAFPPTVVMSPRPLKHCVRIAIHCCAAGSRSASTASPVCRPPYSSCSSP